jgi:hypothetical protein
MSFTCPILRIHRYGRACCQVDVPLTVVNPVGEATRTFRFDTGCDITTVSEDVATALGLPAGGTPIGVRGSTATGTGRLVAVSFRLPPDAISGLLSPVLSSMWIVVPGRKSLALLCLQEVHDQYFISTDDAYIYFTNR